MHTYIHTRDVTMSRYFCILSLVSLVGLLYLSKPTNTSFTIESLVSTICELCNAPINIIPQYLPPRLYRGKVGHLKLI